jgi:hypothetical protein
MKTLRCLLSVLVALIATGNVGWCLGFGLGESKEELGLDYEIPAVDHGTGRVTVVLKIADEGKLKPLTSVDLTVPGGDETGYVDLTVSLEPGDEDGKKVFRVHGLREWIERAEIQLKTRTLDGKEEMMTWYYFSISLKEVIKDVRPKEGEREKPPRKAEGGPPASEAG